MERRRGRRLEQVILEAYMTEKETFTEAEAHLHFAKRFNGMTWDLLDKQERTREEDDMMVNYAHTSLAHWRAVGTGVNLQRGVWMLARVNIVLGNTQMAMQYAGRCLELTEQFKDQLSDFDFAFANECMARAHALGGNQTEAQEYIVKANKAGAAIQDEEDRQIFFDDFNGGDWYGLK
jgi:hypothetical protein